MQSRKEAFHKLREKITKFDEKRKSEFSDLKDFLKIYLNTCEKNQREKLAEDFKERQLEVYDFLKNNPELVSAEREIVKISGGDFAEKSENSQSATNFFEIIKENFLDDL